MNSLVVYYSLDGHTKRIAETIVRLTGADAHELRTAASTGKSGFAKYFLGGMHASFGSKPALLDSLPDLTKYDRVFIGTPVWASRPTPAVNTFLSRAELGAKDVYLFVCSGGLTTQKCFELIKKRLRGAVQSEIAFAESAHESPDIVETRLRDWLAAK